MSDRVTMRLWIYDCPEGQRAAALAALDGLRTAYITDAPDDELNLADYYHDDAFHPGDTDAAEGLALALASAAPGVSFLMRADPDQCYPGIIRACTPALGHYEGEINGDSEVVLSLDRLLPLIAVPESGDSPGAWRRARDSIRKACGKPWLDDFEANWAGR